MDKQFVSQSTQGRHRSMAASQSLWDKIWRDRNGNVIIYQFPNVWLIVWFVLEFVSLVVPSHSMAEGVSWWLATAALGVWSLLEIFQGANYFRRALGLLVAISTIVTVFGVGL